MVAGQLCDGQIPDAPRVHWDSVNVLCAHSPNVPHSFRPVQRRSTPSRWTNGSSLIGLARLLLFRTAWLSRRHRNETAMSSTPDWMRPPQGPQEPTRLVPPLGALAV